MLRTYNSKDKALIFLHIPKAAGTTLHTIIQRQYSSDVIFDIDGSNVQKSIHEFCSLPQVERQKIRCLKGHMPFGLHRYLSAPVSYITMLRDPVDRIISHYYYVLRSPSHYLHNQVVANKMSLDDYVSSGISSELNNGQLRLISGVKKVDSVTGNEPVSTNTLNTAKRNISTHFTAVGISERFDESIVLFRKVLGWKNILYFKRNVAKDRPSRCEISKKTLRTIMKYNELDMELYEFAEVFFEKQVQEQGESFRDEVAKFQHLNRLYGFVCRRLQQLKSLIILTRYSKKVFCLFIP